MSTDLIVNNKGGANLKERWMAREMSTDSLLSALVSKDCGKGKESSCRSRRRIRRRRRREVSLLMCLRSETFAFALPPVCLGVRIKRCGLASRPGQPLWKTSLISVWIYLLSVLWCFSALFPRTWFQTEVGWCCDSSRSKLSANRTVISSIAICTHVGTVMDAPFRALMKIVRQLPR